MIKNPLFLVSSRRRLKPLSLSAWQVNNEISLHLSVEGKVFLSTIQLSLGQCLHKHKLICFLSRCSQFFRQPWLIPPLRW